MFARNTLTVGILAIAAVCFARPDRNAFLNEGAGSTQAIIAQAKRDPEVMDRFRRHYGMTSDQVVAYISTLKLARLKADGVYTVYSVPPSGYIKKHAQKFRQGAWVYVDALGTPAMIARCANPLNRGPEDHEDLAEDLRNNDKTVDELRDVTTDEITAGSVEDLYSPMAPDVPTVLDVPPITTGESAIPVIGAPPIGGWIVGLLGGGLLIGGGGDDGGNDSPPVPEPATLTAIGVGLAGVMAAKRRRHP